MELEDFSIVFERAISMEADAHNLRYPDGGAAAWAKVGAAYLSFALCSLPSARLRNIQYDTKEQYGPVILNCKWYDRLKQVCLNGKDSIQTLLPAPDGTLCQCSVSSGLFLEMLDFCREG